MQRPQQPPLRACISGFPSYVSHSALGMGLTPPTCSWAQLCGKTPSVPGPASPPAPGTAHLCTENGVIREPPHPADWKLGGNTCCSRAHRAHVTARARFVPTRGPRPQPLQVLRSNRPSIRSQGPGVSTTSRLKHSGCPVRPTSDTTRPGCGVRCGPRPLSRAQGLQGRGKQVPDTWGGVKKSVTWRLQRHICSRRWGCWEQCCGRGGPRALAAPWARGHHTVPKVDRHWEKRTLITRVARPAPSTLGADSRGASPLGEPSETVTPGNVYALYTCPCPPEGDP